MVHGVTRARRGQPSNPDQRLLPREAQHVDKGDEPCPSHSTIHRGQQAIMTGLHQERRVAS
jgi:hypothetical protein